MGKFRFQWTNCVHDFVAFNKKARYSPYEDSFGALECQLHAECQNHNCGAVTKSERDHSVWQKPLFHSVIMRLSQEMRARAPWPEINIAGLK